jgi:hypothetical protein
MHARIAFATVSLLSAIVLLAIPAPVAAHEHMTVGEYEFIVGWRSEPPLVGDSNGIDLGIEHDLGNGTVAWVSGAHLTLNATLSIGGASMTSALRPQFGRLGWYTFDVIPTRPGVYSVRVFGSVEGTAVDFAMELEEVEPRATAEFPATDPTPSELQDAVDAATSENAALRAQAGLLLLVSAVALLIGLASLALGGFAWRAGRRKP